MKYNNQLTLIRHGKSLANEQGILCGQVDYDLCQVGIEEAELLSLQLSKLKPEIIFCSPLRRAINTCKIIFPQQQKKVKLDSALIEINTGDLSHKTYSEFYKLYPQLNEAFKFPNFTFPSGESYLSAFKRAKSFYNENESILKHQNTVIVGHGISLNLLMLALLDLDFSHYPLAELENCKINKLIFFEGKFRIQGINKELW